MPGDPPPASIASKLSGGFRPTPVSIRHKKTLLCCPFPKKNLKFQIYLFYSSKTCIDDLRYLLKYILKFCSRWPDISILNPKGQHNHLFCLALWRILGLGRRKWLLFVTSIVLMKLWDWIWNRIWIEFARLKVTPYSGILSCFELIYFTALLVALCFRMHCNNNLILSAYSETRCSIDQCSNLQDIF